MHIKNILVLVGLVASCAGSAGCVEESCGWEADQELAVTKVDGTYEFTWTEDNVVKMTINDVGVRQDPNESVDEAVVWRVEAAPGAKLPSGVRYGVVPAGATAPTAAKDLQPSGNYRALVTMEDHGEECYGHVEFSK